MAPGIATSPSTETCWRITEMLAEVMKRSLVAQKKTTRITSAKNSPFFCAHSSTGRANCITRPRGRRELAGAGHGACPGDRSSDLVDLQKVLDLIDGGIAGDQHIGDAHV